DGGGGPEHAARGARRAALGLHGLRRGARGGDARRRRRGRRGRDPPDRGTVDPRAATDGATASEPGNSRKLTGSRILRAVELRPASELSNAELAELFTAGYADYAFPIHLDEAG